jgi:hypothetical protein
VSSRVRHHRKPSVAAGMKESVGAA